MESTSYKNVIISFLWCVGKSSGAQVVAFIVSIVLARILTPEDYGVVALVTVFTSILQVFVDSGLGTALIQKKNADDTDFSSVFYFNFLICLVLYVVMFFAAPVIASFYNDPIYTPLIRVLCLTLVVSGLKNIQQAYVARNMMFKCFFFSAIGATVASGFLGIGLAYAGFGVWALTAQYLSNAVIDTVILWITVPWRPRKVFDRQRLKGLLSYGWKILVSSLLDTGYNNLQSLLIGRIYSSADLAYYNQGAKFPQTIVSNMDSSIDSVLLPTMSSVQENRNQIKGMARRAIMTSVYIIAPFMMGLAVCADEIVRIVLTDKWMPCVPYLRVFCVTYMFWPMHTANLNAIKAMGRSDLFLRLEIIKKAIGIVLLIGSMRISVMAMAWSLLLSGIISQIVNSYPNWKLLNYRYHEQLLDIMPSVILAMVMALAVSFFAMFHWSDASTLLIQVIVGAAIYIAGSQLLHLESYEYMKEMILSRRRSAAHGEK